MCAMEGAAEPDTSSEFPSVHVNLASRRGSASDAAPSLTLSPTQTSHPDDSLRHHLSNANGHGRPHSNSSSGKDYKNEWAEGLAGQKSLQNSVAGLRESVEIYKKEADPIELEKLNQSYQEVEALRRTATDLSTKASPKRAASTAIADFSSVALEYAKLLDVLMNQCPEYVSLAWGTIKVLLVANINHAKLKQKVELSLVKIGEQLELVNQLTYSLPTEKMVQAVALLYAYLFMFLSKALKYYKQSKPRKAISAFTFPWDLKFQPLLDRIDAQFDTIRELAKAGHFRATLLNQSFLRSLRQGQKDIEQVVNQSKEEVKSELTQGFDELFNKFNLLFTQKWDEIMSQHQLLTKEGSSTNATSKGDFHTELGHSLNDFLSTPEKLCAFHDSAFPEVQQFGQIEKYVRVRNRQLTVYDLRQSLSLLQHSTMKEWISSGSSRMMWVNTWKSGPADWATGFATQLMDHARQLDYVTVVSHFCQKKSEINPGSTPMIIVQSLIAQVLEQHRESLFHTNLTVEQFQAPKDDLSALWSVFLAVLRQSKIRCLWLIIDCIDMLDNSLGAPDQSQGQDLIRHFSDLPSHTSTTAKVFISSRNAGPSRSLSASVTGDSATSLPLSVITIPRSQHRATSTLLAKFSRRPGRLPDNVEFSDQIDDVAKSERSTYIEELEESDSLASLTQEDPFASSDEDTWMTHEAPASNVNPRLQRSKDSFVDESDIDFYGSAIAQDSLATSEGSGNEMDSPKMVRDKGHKSPTNAQNSTALFGDGSVDGSSDYEF